ncbi:MAG: aminotransferase class V-fold PLP-dependent enzyme [Planctomycetes bacterium]|nr:aminotransferase class V-fold PLP-dependent enzyme [Planctomycetota bacterium]MBL7039320.1 aminotransferase class V-fold PLP-dependent enzyme [Pirellulaceae bacterium]
MNELDNPWREFRELMPVARKLAYFDHAAVAPLTNPSAEAVATWSRQAAEEGDTVWPQWEERLSEVRQLAAELIAADTSEVALVPNTTTGINLVAEGFPWREGDNVVTLANEFPSNLYPWMNLASRGVQTRRVPVEGVQVDLNRIADACDQRTRIISASWVGYATGWRLDVAELVTLAHDRGILVFLDAIQGLGVFPIDVRRTGVDFLAADGHKWMLGPEGAGVFYVREEHLDVLRPLNVGWNSVVHAHDFARCELDIRRAASRYEGGSQNMVGFAALGASLEVLARFGLTSETSPIADRILALNEYAAKRLEEIGADIKSSRDRRHASGILSFDLPGRDLAAERQRCLKSGVVLSLRNNWLRISPHAYVSEDDVERLVDALQSA